MVTIKSWSAGHQLRVGKFSITLAAAHICWWWGRQRKCKPRRPGNNPDAWTLHLSLWIDLTSAIILSKYVGCAVVWKNGVRHVPWRNRTTHAAEACWRGNVVWGHCPRKTQRTTVSWVILLISASCDVPVVIGNSKFCHERYFLSLFSGMIHLFFSLPLNCMLHWHRFI